MTAYCVNEATERCCPNRTSRLHGLPAELAAEMRKWLASSRDVLKRLCVRPLSQLKVKKGDVSQESEIKCDAMILEQGVDF